MPFRYLASERVPGARNVYARFEGYVPRDSGQPSFLSGPKIAHFDRVEWVTLPDVATAAAALQSGDVDWLDQPAADLLPLLRGRSTLVVELLETLGLFAMLRSLLRNYRSEQVRSRCRPVSAKSTLYAVWHAAGKSFSNRLLV